MDAAEQDSGRDRLIDRLPYLHAEQSMTNLIVECDRCHHKIEGQRDPQFTAGFYDAAAWSKYANIGESVICDRCMWNDARYQADYGTSSAASLSAPSQPAQGATPVRVVGASGVYAGSTKLPSGYDKCPDCGNTSIDVYNTKSDYISFTCGYQYVLTKYGWCPWYPACDRKSLTALPSAPTDAIRAVNESDATLEKYQSDLDKLHKALGQSNLEVPGGFVEHVCAHLRHVRKEVLRLADLNVITIGRAGEILALTVRQAREEMRKYQEEQRSAVAAVREGEV